MYVCTLIYITYIYIIKIHKIRNAINKHKLSLPVNGFTKLLGIKLKLMDLNFLFNILKFFRGKI